MSIDLPHLLETAADEVASVGRAAAGSINELVHDWGHETRSFVTEHAPSMPSLPSIPSLPSRHQRGGSPLLRLLLPVAVLAVVAYAIMRRRRAKSSPYLPEREQRTGNEHEASAGSVANSHKGGNGDELNAEGAAAS